MVQNFLDLLFPTPVDGIAEVPCGVHVLTNGPLDAPWFKATRGRAEFERIIAEHASDRDAMVAAFLAMLQDRTLWVEKDG